MDCQQALDLLPEFVLGTSPESERAQVEQHLASGCTSCQHELDELTRATSLMAEALEPVAPAKELKRDLMARIADEPQIDLVTTTPKTPRPQQDVAEAPKRRAYLPYLAASLAALAAGTLVANFNQRSETSVAGDPLLRSTPEWRQSVQAAERAFGAPRARLASFAKNEAKPGFMVAIFQDTVADQLHVLASETPAPAEDQALWLWLLDKDGKSLAGGQLEYLGGKRAAGLLDSSGIPASLVEAVITFEPTDKPTKPTGSPVGRARLQRGS